jgi:rubrerythrin
MCKWCNELNTETNDMRIDEIYIDRAGHYGYKTPIKYCPNCGTILNKFKDGQKNVYESE